MKIGISLTASANGMKSHDSIEYCRWAARYADEQGFDIIWTTEHHFTDIAHTGAPTAILAHYAAITERAKLAYGVAIVPLHHPLRLAEEFLWVDNLSNGRLIGGISPGWAAYEFELFGVSLDERRERLAESWEIIRQATRGETVTFHGKFYNVPGIFINPPPRQKEIPFVLSVGKPDSIIAAAKMRTSPVFGAPPVETIVELVNLYDKTLRDDGASEDEIAKLHEHIGVRRFVTIGSTHEDAVIKANYAAAKLRQSLNFLSTTAAPKDSSAQKSDPRDPQTLKNEVYGTPDEIIVQLKELENAGMSHFICNFTIGEAGIEGTKEMIKLFAKEILPVVQDKEPALAR